MSNVIPCIKSHPHFDESTGRLDIQAYKYKINIQTTRNLDNEHNLF